MRVAPARAIVRLSLYLFMDVCDTEDLVRPLLLSICLCLCWVLDQLYSNNAAGAAAKDATDSVMGYGTFYPDSTYSTPPASVATKGENYQTMPPPADQESPYSYGYGEEKKKMLTQNENQGGNYSMYSTAYPSSVTGTQGYSNSYGELIPRVCCCCCCCLRVDRF